MIYSHFFGPVGIKRKRATFGAFAMATKEAAVPLVIPIIIMGGILTGQFTPSEAGVIAGEGHPQHGQRSDQEFWN